MHLHLLLYTVHQNDRTRSLYAALYLKYIFSKVVLADEPNLYSRNYHIVSILVGPISIGS